MHEYACNLTHSLAMSAVCKIMLLWNRIVCMINTIAENSDGWQDKPYTTQVPIPVQCYWGTRAKTLSNCNMPLEENLLESILCHMVQLHEDPSDPFVSSVQLAAHDAFYGWLLYCH